MTFTNPSQRCTLLICHKNPPTLRLLILKMKSWKQSNSETVASAVHNSALHWKPLATTEENIWICIHFFSPNEKVSRKTILFLFFWEGGVLLFCFALLFTCVIVATAWGPGKQAPFIQTLPPPGALKQCVTAFPYGGTVTVPCVYNTWAPPPHHHYHMCHGV